MNDPLNSRGYIHTEAGKAGIIAAGTTAGILSLVTNVMVIVVHFTILYYRPAAVNRVSLRLIVYATFWDSLYCSAQMAIQYLQSGNQSCRAVIYLNVCSELISTLALTMIGVNLVMVFLVHVSQPQKYEKYYYFVTILLTAICMIPPATVWRTTDLNSAWTCWYLSLTCTFSNILKFYLRYQYYYYSRLTSEDQWVHSISAMHDISFLLTTDLVGVVLQLAVVRHSGIHCVCYFIHLPSVARKEYFHGRVRYGHTNRRKQCVLSPTIRHPGYNEKYLRLSQSRRALCLLPH